MVVLFIEFQYRADYRVIIRAVLAFATFNDKPLYS